MILTDKNKEILKSLSGITDQVYFTSDSLSICSSDEQMVAYYDYGVDVDVPAKKGENKPDGFGVYNLNEFLSVLDVYKTPQIKEKETYLVVSEGKSKNKYKYTAKNCITIPPSKDSLITGTKSAPAKLGTLDHTFDITEADIKKIIKQSVILKSPHIVFESNNVTCTDIDNSSVSTFTHEIEGVAKDTLPRVTISSEKFQKIILADYTFAINENAVTLTNKTDGVTYVILGLME